VRSGIPSSCLVVTSVSVLPVVSDHVYFVCVCVCAQYSYFSAASLRYQASNCPICRARKLHFDLKFFPKMLFLLLTAFHALLSLTALQEIDANDEDEITNQQVQCPPFMMSFTMSLLQNSVVPGYKSVPLVQALNGYPIEQKPAPAAAFGPGM